jgi:hypothetical protein
MGGIVESEDRKREVWSGRWRELRKERKEEDDREESG